MIRPLATMLAGLLAAAAALSVAAPILAADDDINAMMNEITQLSAEKKANETKMQPNLSRQDSDRKLAASKRALDAEHDRTESAIDSVCSRYPCTGRGAGGTIIVKCPAGDSGACDSSVKSADAQVKQHNAHRDAYEAERAAAQKQKAPDETLRKRNQEIEARIQFLQGRIRQLQARDRTKAYAECVTGAVGGATLETSVQDYNACVERARQAQQLSTVERETGRVFVDPQARAKEAIDKYVKSGPARPGPQSFHPIVPPVPPPVVQPQTPPKK
ncbi:MAG: hypothetical protein JSR90_18245 [Proteobacteria bacterium]|nr:hypothetical protein [Pseudomonadota bacterium]